MNRRQLAAALVLLPFHQSPAEAAPTKGAAKAIPDADFHAASWKRGWDAGFDWSMELAALRLAHYRPDISFEDAKWLVGIGVTHGIYN